MSPNVKVPPPGPELFFGLVAAIGTDLDRVSDVLVAALADVAYDAEVVRLSELLREIGSGPVLEETPRDRRYQTYMDKGTYLREQTGRGDALAVMAVRRIRRLRSGNETGDERDAAPRSRTAYILRSLKHPDEVVRLREVYGSGFFLIGAYSPRDRRLKYLEEQIAASHHASPPTLEHTRKAEDLIVKDEKEAFHRLGQNVGDTFPLADVFVDVSRSEEEVRVNIERFIALLFGYPFHTPRRDESAMFHARAAALRSAELGRQVGAAITDEMGDLMAVGTNEIPRAGGGTYWAPERVGDPDDRDFTKGEDTSDRFKRNNLAEILTRIRDQGWLTEAMTAKGTSELLDESLPFMRSTRLMNSIEFGRAVHAEMTAITGAALRGTSIRGTTLYSTTFPCHNCAKHIVSAGIARVVYIEPYAKSLAYGFHEEEIALERPRTRPEQVSFEPFVGVAPRLYLSLFEMTERKEKDGRRVEWNKAAALPRAVPPVAGYMGQEGAVGDGLLVALENANIEFATPVAETQPDE
jgi:deoxycytidylate deaminase